MLILKDYIPHEIMSWDPPSQPGGGIQSPTGKYVPVRSAVR